MPDFFDGLGFGYPEEPQEPIRPIQRPDDTGDFMRGFKVDTGQIVPTLKGVVGYAGDVAEKTFGEGGISTAVKDWGYKGYVEGNKKLEPLRRDTDDVTVAWDRLTKGDIGSFVDFVQYGLGYAAGEAVQTGVTAWAGSMMGGAAGAAAGGPAAPVTGAAGAVAGAVAGAAGRKAAWTLVQKSLDAQVAKMVAGGMAEKLAIQKAPAALGSELALLTTNVSRELGSIYGEGREEAEKNGTPLDGIDLARMLGSALVAGKIETLADTYGIGAALGKAGAKSASRAVRAGTAALSTGVVEGGTELGQTVVERFGAGKALTGDEATNDYLNSTALGIIGGTALGGAGGAMSSGPKPADIIREIFDDKKTTVEQVMSASGKMVNEILRPAAGSRLIDDAAALGAEANEAQYTVDAASARIDEDLQVIRDKITQQGQQPPGQPPPGGPPPQGPPNAPAGPPDAGADVGQAVPPVVPQPPDGLPNRPVDNPGPVGAGVPGNEQRVGGGLPVGVVAPGVGPLPGAADGVQPAPVADAVAPAWTSANNAKLDPAMLPVNEAMLQPGTRVATKANGEGTLVSYSAKTGTAKVEWDNAPGKPKSVPVNSDLKVQVTPTSAAATPTGVGSANVQASPSVSAAAVAPAVGPATAVEGRAAPGATVAPTAVGVSQVQGSAAAQGAGNTDQNAAPVGPQARAGVERLVKQFPNANITEVDSATLPTSGAGLTQRGAGMVKQLAGLFRKNVVFFRGDIGTEGLVYRSDRENIYINADASSVHHLVLVGHEIAHHMERDAPQLHKWLKGRLTESLKGGNLANLIRDYHPGWDKNQVYGALRDPKMVDQFTAEFIADLIGNRLGEKKTFSELFATARGRDDQYMVFKFGRFLIDFINDLLARVNIRKFKADGYLKEDLKRVQRDIRKVLKTYAVQQNMNPMQAEIAEMRARLMNKEEANGLQGQGQETEEVNGRPTATNPGDTPDQEEANEQEGREAGREAGTAGAAEGRPEAADAGGSERSAASASQASDREGSGRAGSAEESAEGELPEPGESAGTERSGPGRQAPGVGGLTGEEKAAQESWAAEWEKAKADPDYKPAGWYGDADNPLRFISGLSRVNDFNAAFVAGGSVGVQIGEMSNNAIDAMAEALVKSPDAHLFIDSGAFSLGVKNEKEGTNEQLDFDKVLAKYERLQRAIDKFDDENEGSDYSHAASRILFVMPDVYMNQAASIAVAEKHATAIGNYIKYGFHAIVPIQKGELTATQVYDRLTEILGQKNLLVGVPSVEEAFGLEDLRTFLKERGDDFEGIHFLGAGSLSRLQPRLNVVKQDGFDGNVSADAGSWRGKLAAGNRQEQIAEAAKPKAAEKTAEEIRAEKTAPVENATELHPDAAEETLVLMACSLNKKSTADGNQIPLHKLYTGGFWLTLKSKMRGKKGLDWSNIIVLSSKFGMVSSKKEALSYDEKMTKERANELIDKGLDPHIVRHGGTGGYQPGKWRNVIIVGSGDYSRVWNAMVREMQEKGVLAPDVRIVKTKGMIGIQKQQLGTFLKQAQAKSAPETNQESESQQSTRREFIVGSAAALASSRARAETKLGKAVPITEETVKSRISPKAEKMLWSGKNGGKTQMDGAQRITAALKEIASTGPVELRPLAAKVASLMPEKGLMLMIDDTSRMNAHGVVRLMPFVQMELFTAGDHTGLSHGTFIHESLHAAIAARYRTLNSGVVRDNDTVLKLAAPKASAALEQFSRVFMEFRSHMDKAGGGNRSEWPIYLKEAYGDPDEFFVRALTSADFQKLLSGYKYEGKTLLQRFKDWVITSLLGFRREGTDASWLDAALTASNDLVEGMAQDPADWERLRAQNNRSSSAQRETREATEDSQQSTIRAQTETPQFKKWFRESTVVDENGEPRVMYHGTTAKKDFSVFNTNVENETGSHFGTIDQAHHFVHKFAPFGKTGLPKPGGRVMPVFLRVENPLRLEDEGTFDVGTVASQLIGHPDAGNIITPEQYEKYVAWAENFSGTEHKFRPGEFNPRTELVEAIEDAGYDGIVYLNRGEGTGESVPGSDIDRSEGPDSEYRKGFPDAKDSYIVFHPNQVKSAIANRGTFSDRSGDIQKSTKRAFKAIEAVAGIESAFTFAKSQHFQQGRDLKVALQERVREEAAKAGIDLTSQTDQATQDYLVRMAVKDALYGLSGRNNAVGWYNEKVTKALRVSALTYTELNTDPQARFAYIWALAVTSNGLKVPVQFPLADKVYERFKRTGKMGGPPIGAGQAKKAIDNGLADYDRMVKAYGLPGLMRFMVTKMTVRDILAAGFKVSGEGIDTPVYGAAILGAKIGNGFFMNLNGEYGQLTMDRWYMRAWGRWTGTLITDRPDLVDQKRDQIRELVGMLSDTEVAAFEKAVGQQLDPADPDAMALAIAEASADPDIREVMNQIGRLSQKRHKQLLAVLGDPRGGDPRKSMGSELRKMGLGLTKAIDGQKEAPANAGERDFIRSIMTRALAELQKKHPDLTMADFQAILWYPEKKLYDVAKSKDDDANEEYDTEAAPDYANAAVALATSKGIDPAKITAVLKGVDDEIQAARHSRGTGRDQPVRAAAAKNDAPDRSPAAGKSGVPDRQGTPESAGGLEGQAEGLDDAQQSTKRAVPYMGDLTPTQDAIVSRVLNTERLTLREKATRKFTDWKPKFIQGVADEFRALKDFDMGAYILARLSKGSDGALEASMLYGPVTMRDGVYDVKVTPEGGFANVMAALKGEHQRFFMWVAAMRAERLKAEGRENLMTDTDISELKTLNKGREKEFAAALSKLNEYNEAVLRVALDAGFINNEAFKTLKDQPYVPFYRVWQDEKVSNLSASDALTSQYGIKALKGGKEKLNDDLFENLMMNWSHILGASMRNRAGVKAIDAASAQMIAYQLKVPQKGSVKIMRDGKAEHWMVTDPYLLDAISAVEYQMPDFMKPISWFKRKLTFGVTASPAFKIRNLMRDTLSAVAQADLSYNVGKNLKQGFAGTKVGSQTHASLLASGGIIRFGSMTEGAQDTHALIVRSIKDGSLLNRSNTEKLMSGLQSVWQAYSDLGDRGENINRAALYEQLIAQGVSHAEASFRSRDLLDFSMSGRWPVVRFLTQSVPFLNARIQGLYKLGRAAKEDPKRMATMVTAVSLASLALALAYGDDDDWKKREDWDRDNYWWFKIGDKAFRIPKPFELGAMGTLAERTYELMVEPEMTSKRYRERLGFMLTQTFAFSPVPQVMKPLADMYANMDSFTGRPIESTGMERLRPQDRYNERTSQTAKFLGSLGLPNPGQMVMALKYEEMSPVQIDHMFKAYFGWLGTAVTTGLDYGLRPLAGAGEKPAMTLRDVFGSFAESVPSNSSRYVSQMYKQATEIEQAYASHRDALKRGDYAGAAEIMAEDGDKIRLNSLVTKNKKSLTDLNNRAKRIEGDRDMSAEAKRAELDVISKQRNRLAEEISKRLTP